MVSDTEVNTMFTRNVFSYTGFSASSLCLQKSYGVIIVQFLYSLCHFFGSFD